MNFCRNKKLFSLLIFSLFVFAFFKVPFAGAAPNVTGEAVLVSGGTAYWVRFDKADCDSDSNNYIDVACGGDNASAQYAISGGIYGATISDTTGVFSGKVWYYEQGAKILKGWIDFDSRDGSCTGSPWFGSNCGIVTFADPNISGWGRATDSLAGWINFSGVSVNASNELRNSASWVTSGSVSGSLYFNCNDESQGCSSSLGSYSTLYTGSENAKPTATADPVQELYCTKSGYPVSPDEGKVAISWVYSDAESDPQAEYKIQIDTDSGFTDPVECSYSGVNNTSQFIAKLSPGAGCSPIQINYGQTYYWRVSVKAGSGNLDWSDWGTGASFTTPANPYPYAKFTPPAYPHAEVDLTFTDNSKCYSAGAMIDCNDPSIVDSVTYAWDFNEGTCPPVEDPPLPPTTCPTSADKGATIHRYTFSGSYWAELGITQGGITCTYQSLINVGVAFTPPTWIEITPF